MVVGDEVVGWVDYDTDRDWLLPGEVNVGYNVFAPHRGRGYATRAVQLLMHHLVGTEFHTATLAIDRGNERSIALASRIDFVPSGEVGESLYFKRPVPPSTYTDGTVTLRRLDVDDIDKDLEAKDDAQITWMWLPGEREHWDAMSLDEQRAHALRGLQERTETFGSGPKWTFAVDTANAGYVAYVDCDLANDHVPAGEANISYSSHPEHRGKGYVTRGARLIIEFLRDNTGAREAHLIVDAENAASLRVVRAVGAVERERFAGDPGRTMIRHVVAVKPVYAGHNWSLDPPTVPPKP